MKTPPPTETSAGRLATYLLDKGIVGAGPLSSAASLADDYLTHLGYDSDDERVDALIRAEATKNFTTGFLTGLGGIVTFPVSIPTALGASWLIQARLAGAIARIYGHDLDDPKVRTKVLLSLAGDVAREAIKDLGLGLDNKLTQRAVDQIPGRALVEINKRIGARLLGKVGQRTLLRFPRAVPIIGGVVGGSLDAMVCRMVGRTAKTLFARPTGAILEGEVVSTPRKKREKRAVGK